MKHGSSTQSHVGSHAFLKGKLCKSLQQVHTKGLSKIPRWGFCHASPAHHITSVGGNQEETRKASVKNVHLHGAISRKVPTSYRPPAAQAPSRFPRPCPPTVSARSGCQSAKQIVWTWDLALLKVNGGSFLKTEGIVLK